MSNNAFFLAFKRIFLSRLNFYGKPNAAKVTEPKDTSTPKSSPERVIVKSKKARIEKGSFPVRTSARISKQKL